MSFHNDSSPLIIIIIMGYYYVPISVLLNFQALTHFILTISRESSHYYLNLTDEETEDYCQERLINLLKLPQLVRDELNNEQRQSASKDVIQSLLSLTSERNA